MKKTLVLAIAAGMLLISSAEVCAVNYYVDATGGNDTNNGQSNATAWRTINKVNNYSFQTGDDVYLKCGEVWTEEWLYIDWSGAAGNRAVVDAYYMDGDTEVIGVSGNKPVFDGNDTVPGDINQGLIMSAYNRTYQTIENIKVINSEGCGVTTNRGSNINLKGIETDNIYNAGIKYYGVQVGIIEGCDVKNACRKQFESPGTNWPAAMALVGASKNILVKNNIVHENYGEGIGVYHQCELIDINSNILFSNKKVNIYICQSRFADIYNNLIYGTTDPEFFRQEGWPWTAISISDEPGYDYAYNEGCKVFNNLIAYCRKGIAFGATHEDAVVKDHEVYNNTIVGCRYAFGFNGPWENSFIKNNIIWFTDSDVDVCQWTTSTPGLTWENNLWSHTIPAAFSSSSDVSGLPKLTKTSGWRSMTAGSLNGSDFTLQPNSPAIESGTSLVSPYNQGLNPASTWPNNVSTLDQNNCGTGWEIGAYVFTGIACLPIDQTGWELLYVDSEEMGNVDRPATDSFDGDPDTIWHTEWSLTDPDPAHPHEIQIDLGGFYDICGFRYLPRQEEEAGGENGMIKDYEFYVSNNTDDWGTAITSGTFVKDKTEKQVSFDCTLGQYVRLVALSEVNGNPWTTMAELNVLAVQPDTDINDDGKVNIEDFAVLSVWWNDEDACSSPGWCDGADFDMSGTVDMLDFTYFVENWLRHGE